MLSPFQDAGVALRGLFLIDPKGTLRQITINDLPVGRSVDETIRLIKAFQFVSCFHLGCYLSWDLRTAENSDADLALGSSDGRAR